MKNKKAIVISGIILIVILFTSAIGCNIYSKNKIDKQISEFEKYIFETKEMFNDLLLDGYTEEYNKLLKESDEIISSKEISKIEEIKKSWVNLNEIISSENESNLKSQLKEIKKIDISDYDNKESIEEDIDEADELIDNKKYNKASDKIDDINIQIEKDKNKLEEVNQKKQEEELAIKEAIEKAQNIKVDNYTASRDNVENVIRGYLKAFPKAVNSGDFNKITNYIYPNSDLYNEQKVAVESWYEQGIKEKFLGFTAKEITFSDDKLEGTLISEEVFEIENDAGTRTETFNWLYKFKYNTDIENYQIIEICNP